MSSAFKNVFIVGAKRTPIGSFMGALSSMSAPQLGGVAIRSALAQGKIPAPVLGQVYMGNVISAGIGQAPARQAAKAGNIPDQIGATTINKVCGSGLMAVHLASQAIRLGEAQACVAGGMESMSQAPYLVCDARSGLKLGNQSLVDALVHDGLWDPYNDFHMGKAAELCAKERRVSRDDQDAYAKQSYERARQATAAGDFRNEITPIELKQKKGAALIISDDEEPSRYQPEKFSSLKPVFQEGGSVTAANASSINDGAAALVLTDEALVKSHGCEVLGRIVGFAGAAREPEWFTVAPAAAIRNLLQKTGIKINEIDLFEINEAFSVVALAIIGELELDPTRVNIRGGAVALGHPLGASGARILTTLLYTMREKRLKRGVAAICLGGGEAIAMMVEAA